MCGIIAYLKSQSHSKSNNNQVIKVILDGLKQLQNRGYDSAGIWSQSKLESESKFFNYKKASTKDQNAIDILDTWSQTQSEENLLSGLGHTRWATHGGKTDANAHPHQDQNKELILVHNGIIENYIQLKKELQGNGYHFQSETDTEVIVQLISYYYTTKNEKETYQDLTESFQKTISRLEGTWGLAVLKLNPTEDQPELLLARKGSPLLLAYDEEFVMVSSEESGFCNYVSEFTPLKDNDLITVFRNKDNKFEIKFLNQNNSRQKTEVKSDLQTLLPPHFPHWTLKEIWETPMASLRAYNNGGRLQPSNNVKLGGLDAIKDQLLNKKNLILLGCGTSYHAGQLALKYFHELGHSGFETIDVIDASEFEESQLPRVKPENILLVHLSQSGETRDLQKCIELGKQKNFLQLGVINVVDSLIAREVDAGCYINAGREVGVASTKSFVNQVIVLSMMAIWFAQQRENQELTKAQRKKIIQDLRRLTLDLEKVLQFSSQEIQTMAQEIKNTEFRSLYLLGKGNCGVALAQEGALKIKELSYYHAEGSSASSLKHGPFGLLEENYPVILMAMSHPNSAIAKIKNSFQEIISRKAKVFLITDLNKKELGDFHQAYQIIQVPENSSYQELVAIIPIQLLSYYLALLEGNNPDFPRNLAKVVTVE